MGLSCQAILTSHIDATEIADYIETISSSTLVGIRSMRSEDHKVIEFFDQSGAGNSVDIFLNSFAADDYVDVYVGSSTFLSMSYEPKNTELLRMIVSKFGGYLKANGNQTWTEITTSLVRD
jgi:hypothetical protein